jgi:hypothetical protein
MAKGGQPFAGARGVPATFLLSLAPPAAARKRGKKGFCGDTWGLATRAPRQGVSPCTLTFANFCFKSSG